MKRSSLILLAACLGLFATFYTGCQTVTDAGQSAVSYIRGDLRAPVGAPVTEVYQAARQAVASLQFIEARATADALTGEIHAYTAQDQKITIWVNEVTRQTSDITIRIGAIGDEALSRRIYAEILEAL